MLVLRLSWVTIVSVYRPIDMYGNMRPPKNHAARSHKARGY